MAKMAYLMEIRLHLKDLGEKLQGSDQLVNTLYQQVFEKKLVLWKAWKGKLRWFPTII